MKLKTILPKDEKKTEKDMMMLRGTELILVVKKWKTLLKELK